MDSGWIVGCMWFHRETFKQSGHIHTCRYERVPVPGHFDNHSHLAAQQLRADGEDMPVEVGRSLRPAAERRPSSTANS
jgi:hypothetical protein